MAAAELQTAGLRERKAANAKVTLAFAVLTRFPGRTLADISAKELADAAQISEATFFNYFSKKTDLLLYLTQLLTVELVYHAERKARMVTGLPFIRAFFERGAVLMDNYPWAIHEIYGHQVLLRDIPHLDPVTPVERALAFPDMVGEPERVTPCTILDLIRRALGWAVANGSLPDDADLDSAAIGANGIFFGVPIALTFGDPSRVSELYHHQLDVLWEGVRAISAPKQGGPS